MIEHLRLQNFRSYADETFEFGEGVNIVVGPNASGKTNLLEAIQVICTGQSYRAGGNELIAFDQPWARLESVVDQHTRIVKLDRRDHNLKKSYKVDQKDYIRLPLTQSVPLVLFEPGHLRLLNGSPEMRRVFMDDLLEQTVMGFGGLRRSYKRALAQRNRLLKAGPTAVAGQIFAWNIRLSELGGQIAQARQQLIHDLDRQLGTLYLALSTTKTKVGLNYKSACPSVGYSSAMLKKLEQHQDLDMLRGFTAYGPHRDDMAVLFDGHTAQDAASRGEIRTALLGLKIVELQLLEAVRGQKPLLLLDDVFSELDGARRQALTSFLKDYQTFITTTDADVVVQHFIDECTIIPTSHS